MRIELKTIGLNLLFATTTWLDIREGMGVLVTAANVVFVAAQTYVLLKDRRARKRAKQ